MSKHTKKSTTVAEDIAAIFQKAISKSEKALRHAEFDSYYDESRAEEYQAHLTAAVAGTLAYLITGVHPLDPGFLDGEDNVEGGVSVSYDQGPEDDDNVVQFPQPVVQNFHVHESVSARATAEEFQRIIKGMLDERIAPNAARFLSGAEEAKVKLSENRSAADDALEALQAKLEGLRAAASDRFDPVQDGPEFEPVTDDGVQLVWGGTLYKDIEKKYDPKGWPLDTPVSEMTEGEQVLWWKHQSRKNEARAKKYYAEANDLREKIGIARANYQARQNRLSMWVQTPSHVATEQWWLGNR